MYYNMTQLRENTNKLNENCNVNQEHNNYMY